MPHKFIQTVTVRYKISATMPESDYQTAKDHFDDLLHEVSFESPARSYKDDYGFEADFLEMDGPDAEEVT